MSSGRGRIIITPGGPWRLYTHSIKGWEMLGTVQRGMEVGALGKSPAGLLAMVNAGTASVLDQRKAAAALASGGRAVGGAS